MEQSPTTSVREAAARWTLAGDSQLLEVLQTLHQRIVGRCEETSRRLEEMVSSLDLASLQLANVNNRFLALSNSQFVESRVYEDDADVSARAPAHPAPAQEAAGAAAAAEVDRLKQSMRVLESFHETVTILRDSDTESDSDDGDIARVVLKPKDLYSTRPLPHIIGSPAWRSKWHAGLVVETSDSDSELSGQGGVVEQYSQSEEEMEEPMEQAHRGTRTGSTSSSDVRSEHPRARAPGGPSPTPAPSPAAVAAELARRLRAHVPAAVGAPPPAHPAHPVQRKVYRVEKPAPGAIFLDEPPPLEPSDEESDQGDIFAELHKNKPYSNTRRDHSRLADDLFGQNDLFSEHQPYSDRNRVESDEGDIFSDFAHMPKNEVTQPSAKQKSSLFQDEEEPELFAEKAQKPTQPVSDTENTSGIKKPIGGVPLFGPNKNSHDIGAAILKRNQPKSFNSDEEFNDDSKEPPKAKSEREETPQMPKKEKDIFDDLFAKSEKIQKKNVQQKIVKDVVKKPEKKVDLFSDNLFDDIDDIFTSNIVTKVALKVPSKGQKSLFDDVDDLFADVDVNKDVKVSKQETKISKETKPSTDKETRNIFDSEDELFSAKTSEEKPDSQKMTKPAKSSESTKTLKATKVNDTTKLKETKSLFDDGDNDIFSNAKLTTPAQEIKNNEIQNKEINTTDFEIKSSINTLNSETHYSQNFQDNTQKDSDFFINNKTGQEIKITSKEPPKFEDEDSDDIFAKPRKGKSKPIITSSNLFDDDDEEEVDLFAKSINTSENSSKTPKDDELFITNPKHDQKQNVYATSHSKENPISTETDTVHNDDNIFSNVNEDTLADSNNSQNIPSKRKDTEVAKETDNVYSNESREENDFNPLNENSNTKEGLVTKIIKEDSVKGKPNSFKEPVETPSNIFDDHDEELFKKPIGTTYLVQEGENGPAHMTSIAQTAAIKKVSAKEQNNVSKIEFKTPEPEVTQTEINEHVKKPELDNMRKVDSNKNVTVTNTSEARDNESDVFSDIFNDQPPIFEKPKEPKKSKNVNALFDDDSDDEALFFRKSDVLLDEKSDDFGSNSNQDLFGVFADEPPAIDTFEDALNNTPVDFVTEMNKNKENESIRMDPDEDLYTPQTKDNAKIDKVPSNILSTIFPSLENELSDDIDGAISQDQNLETKKIGKLKPMNFNINVSTLLPGASPKKTQKINEQTDGQVISTKNNEDTSNVKEIGTKLVKSISFESDPDSLVLNNQLSKERAKIQVKRRPSTRRARREAVKISGIDFGEDSTDNSSSIDDPPRKNTAYASNKKNVQEKRIETLVQEDRGNVSRESTDYSDSITSSPSNKKGEASNDSSNQETNSISNIVGSVIGIEPAKEIKSPLKDSPSRDVKSKIVYVLNDEDIFTNVPPSQSAVTSSKSEEVKTENTKTKILKILDDDDDIFKTMAVAPTIEKPENKKYIEGINTLGKVYTEPSRIKQNVEDTKKSNAGSKISQQDSDDDIFKDFAHTASTSKTSKILETTSINTDKSKSENIPSKNHKGQTAKSKKSIFDDLSDEENALFNKNQNTITKKPAIFSSDSEEDLFAGGSKRETTKKDIGEVKSEKSEVKKEIKKVEVKASLFGDEDDDDDLFGVKTKKVTEPKSMQASSAKEDSSKKSQPAFEDPLSLFGDDH